jgi:HNH endonuclease
MKPPVTPIESFDKKYIPEPFSGCWLWTGSITGAGYGRIKTGGFRMDAHRAAFVLFRGKIPSGLFVLHKCDVKLCVNPDHLFLGTGTDNMRDCLKKGRAAIREKHGCAKLNWSDVTEIRNSNESQKSLSERYCVSQSHISEIKAGRFWQPIAEME